MSIHSPVGLSMMSQSEMSVFSSAHLACLNHFYNNVNPEHFGCFSYEDQEEAKIRRPILTKDLEIECQLGEGAQGNIYLTKHKTSEKKYALKVFKKNKPLRKAKTNEIQNEAKILDQLNHPFIIECYQNYETDSYNSLLLEFCQGGDLLYHCQRMEESTRKFSESSVKFYIACLAMALDHIHSQGYVYRDLKPENVLIDQEGYPKIWDFGLSISQADIDFKTAKKHCGTQEYFSPEIVNREVYGKEVDWWSLGILTYELLFSETPFEDSNIFVANDKIKSQDPNFWKRGDLSSEWIDFISQLLSKDKNNRIGMNGIKEISNHPWFSDVDWKAIESKESPSPYSIKGVSTSDTHFFWEGYTQKSVDFKLLDS